MSAARCDVGVVWFRRDLRLEDHAALTEASQACSTLLPVFVIGNAALCPRQNQQGCCTGVPMTGPHQMRCAPAWGPAPQASMLHGAVNEMPELMRACQLQRILELPQQVRKLAQCFPLSQ